MPNETLPIAGWLTADNRIATDDTKTGAMPSSSRENFHIALVRLSDAQAALAAKDAEIAILKTDLRALQAFTAEVFGDFPEHGDIDGIDLQIAAEACGLLKRENIAAPCGENCACAQCGVDGLTDCYRVQPVFMRARMAIADLDSLRAIVEQTKKESTNETL